MLEFKHIGFHKIDQFRSVVREAPKQKVKFTGTVKLHGTNASVVYKDGFMYPQSRERVLAFGDDNYGFASFVLGDDKVNNLLIELFNLFDPITNEVAIYGEWCGKGIQKGVAISSLDRMFVIFAVKVNGQHLRKHEWVNAVRMTLDTFSPSQIFCIHDFPSFSIEIDFNYPELSTPQLEAFTKEVEEQCPVAKAFGIEGLGEGIVWVSDEFNFTFKTKGQKHSVSKVKTLAPVDVEKVSSIREFIEYSVTENRLEQGLSIVTPDFDIKKMGDFLRWVFNDIVTEEKDTLEGNGLNQKEVGKYISQKAREWFLNKMGEI